MATDTLLNMVRNLRSEAGHSLAVSQGVNQVDTLKYILKRTQEELWVAFVWPDMKLRVNVPALVDQYLYPFPASMAFDQIREAWWAQTGASTWSSVGYGVNESMIKPDDSNTQKGTPVQFWDVVASAGASAPQIRMWPTPSATGNVRLIGNKPLAPFIADADVCTLDATLITLFAAAELLARAKAEDAAMKQQKAQRHLLKLLGTKISAKNKVSTLGGYSGRATPTPGLDYIPRVS